MDGDRSKPPPLQPAKARSLMFLAVLVAAASQNPFRFLAAGVSGHNEAGIH
jgi:hypothetical protein